MFVIAIIVSLVLASERVSSRKEELNLDTALIDFCPLYKNDIPTPAIPKPKSDRPVINKTTRIQGKKRTETSIYFSSLVLRG